MHGTCYSPYARFFMLEIHKKFFISTQGRFRNSNGTGNSTTIGSSESNSMVTAL